MAIIEHSFYYCKRIIEIGEIFIEHSEVLSFRLKGVSFENEDGISRQLLLRRIRFRDPPFDEHLDAEIREYEFDGKPAFGVFVNNYQVGNISKNDVPMLLERWEEVKKITAFEVIGGGQDEDENPLHYGAEVFVRFGDLNEEPKMPAPELIPKSTKNFSPNRRGPTVLDKLYYVFMTVIVIANIVVWTKNLILML